MLNLERDPAAMRRFKKHTKTEGDCIVWTAYSNPGGYGQFKAGKREDGRNIIILAHRYAYFCHSGEDAGQRLVCHKCDNRLCVKPEHLFLGDHADNNRDMFAKGRGHRLDGSHIIGEQNKKAKLTERHVLDTRQARRDGSTLPEVAVRFGVTAQNVFSIVHRKTWRHLE